MSKANKVSSVASSRVHNSYVNRATTVNRATSIDPVGPVPRANNETSYSSGNYLLTSDLFYESLNKLRTEYKKFYHHHRKLEEAIENFEFDLEILQHTKELILKYNDAISSLKGFDKTMGTYYTKAIIMTMEVYLDYLKGIGINVNEDGEMYMDEKLFTKTIEHSEDPMLTIFNPMKSLVLKLYKGFKNIRIPSSKAHEVQYGETLSKHVTGLIMDDLS